MTDSHEILSSLLGILSRHPEGLRVKDLAGAVGMNRNAVAKYLGILHQQGRVDIRCIGKAKLFSVSQRIPFSILTEVIPDFILGVDRNLNCAGANSRFYEWVGCTPAEILGKHIENLPTSLFQRPQLSDLARNGISSVCEPVRVSSSWQNRERIFEIQCRPVIFENGTTGSAIIIKDITDTETAAAEISIRGEKYQALADAQSEYIIHSSPDGTITYANSAFSKLAKIPDEQLTGKGFALNIPEDDLFAFKYDLCSINCDNPEKSTERRVLTPSGDIRWIRWKNRGIFRNGMLTGYHSHGTDITELTLAREELRLSQENTENMIHKKTEEFQKIQQDLHEEIHRRTMAERSLQKLQFCINNSSEMILWAGETGIITSSNKSALDMLGIIPGNEIYFLRPEISVQPRQLIPWHEIWEPAKQSGYYLFEAVLPDKSKEIIHAEVLASHLYFDDSELCCLFVRDITCQKRALEALRESESRLSSIIRIAPVGIGIVSDQIIQMVNDQIFLMTGYTAEEFIGRSTRFLFPTQEEYDIIHRKRLFSSAQEGSVSIETKWRKKDGAIIDVLLSWLRIDPSDSSKGWMCTALGF